MTKDSSEVELFTSGSFKEIALKMELEWWEESRKKIDKLSKEIGFDIIEVLPDEYRQNYILNKEELDEENQEDRFYLKTFPPSKSGNEWEIVCSNSVFKATKKITKKEKNEVLDILNGLSQEPSGSSLPKPHKVKTLTSGNEYLKSQFIGFNIDDTRNDHQKPPTFFQYKCGSGGRKRCIWTPDIKKKKVTIHYYGSRNKLESKWR